MKKLLLVFAVVFCLSVISAAPVVRAASDDDPITLTARLNGDNEVPPINTPATGTFKAVQTSPTSFSFTFTFANLRAPLVVSHLHFAPSKVAGGVMIFLCGGDSQPACPATTSGTFTGTFGPANVVGPAGQGIAAGDFASALEAVLEGNSYWNVHTTMFPGGEARGQVKAHRGDHDHDKD